MIFIHIWIFYFLISTRKYTLEFIFKRNFVGVGILVWWVKPLLGPFWVPATQLLIQLADNVSGKQQIMDLNGVAGSRLQPSPVPSIAAIWEVNQQWKLVVSLSHSAFHKFYKKNLNLRFWKLNNLNTMWRQLWYVNMTKIVKVLLK